MLARLIRTLSCFIDFLSFRVWYEVFLFRKSMFAYVYIFLRKVLTLKHFKVEIVQLQTTSCSKECT